MPRPPQNVRIARLAAVLELDDSVRETETVPDVATVGTALALNIQDAARVRRHLAQRHGVPVPPPPPPPAIRLADGAPPPPDSLTPAELACYRVLALARTPLSAADIYAQAFVCEREYASGDSARIHIRHMRAKGIGVERQYGVGYWLAAKAVAS